MGLIHQLRQVANAIIVWSALFLPLLQPSAQNACQGPSQRVDLHAPPVPLAATRTHRPSSARYVNLDLSLLPAQESVIYAQPELMVLMELTVYRAHRAKDL
jgi:hypothetical protein